MATILEQGETIVNVHTEHKNKRKRRAVGKVAIVTVTENKRYRISFFKRRRMHDYSSVPFGYIFGRYWRKSRVTARTYMGDDLKFKDRFICLLCGPSVSGKSSFTISFLQNHKVLCTEPNFSSGIIWFCVRVAPSPIVSWPGRNTFVFTKARQHT